MSRVSDRAGTKADWRKRIDRKAPYGVKAHRNQDAAAYRASDEHLKAVERKEAAGE